MKKVLLVLAMAMTFISCAKKKPSKTPLELEVSIEYGDKVSIKLGKIETLYDYTAEVVEVSRYDGVKKSTLDSWLSMVELYDGYVKDWSDRLASSHYESVKRSTRKIIKTYSEARDKEQAKVDSLKKAHESDKRIVLEIKRKFITSAGGESQVTTQVDWLIDTKRNKDSLIERLRIIN